MNFRKLEVYQKAIRVFTLGAEAGRELPPGHGEIRDQLRRASLSIPLNIAEASGKTQPADQRRFFAFARGSAMECAALVDACVGPHFSLPICLTLRKLLRFAVD